MRVIKQKSTSSVFVCAVAGVALLAAIDPPRKNATAAQPPARASAPDAIGCLGRNEPGDGIVRLGARSISGQPSIIGRLLVAEQDHLKKGQIVAELDSAEQLRAIALLAESQVDVARKRLKQVQIGAKLSDVAAQRAEIERIDIELDNARKELRRQETLLQGNAATEAAVDQARVRVETLARLRQQAVDRLASLSEVRPIDVEVAQAEVQTAIRAAARARAESNASLIRSPLDGRVLKIHASPGEQVGSAGVMELADTEHMYVLAEVAETDMARVRAGQRARISGRGLPGELTGTVDRVALHVTQNSILKLNPAEFSDARIVEVRIRLDDSARVTNLIHLRVNVVIDAAGAAR